MNSFHNTYMVHNQKDAARTKLKAVVIGSCIIDITIFNGKHS